MEEEKFDFTQKIKHVNEIVELEVKSFAVLKPRSKVNHIASRIRAYLNSKNSADYYSRKEKIDPKYTSKREIAEYVELLDLTRVRKFISMLSDNELNLYIDFLQTKYDEAMSETDLKKRFKKYDLVIAGCQLCKVDNVDVMSRVDQIKTNCKRIIDNIPTM